MANIDAQIQSRIHSFVAELTALVRQAAVEAVADALGTSGRAAAHHVRAQKGHAPAAAAAASTGGRRSSEQIAAMVGRVHAFIKSHPNTRSEVIRTELKLPRPVVQDAIDRLKDEKKIKMKGVKRGATYAAV